ncbi:MAG: 4-phosphopantetheinyl transferase family protein [Lachnospiraceae bacterium]|nr:4-phosphopantetheinyl transferase family protein [Lachnospiraceae bacterium]
MRPVKDNLIARVLTEDERVYLRRVSADEASRAEWFTRFWTLKESYLKYTGAGLSGSLQSVSFRFEEHFSENEPRITCSDPSVTLYQVSLSDGIILSACTGSKDPFSLRSVSLP